MTDPSLTLSHVASGQISPLGLWVPGGVPVLHCPHWVQPRSVTQGSPPVPSPHLSPARRGHLPAQATWALSPAFIFARKASPAGPLAHGAGGRALEGEHLQMPSADASKRLLSSQAWSAPAPTPSPGRGHLRAAPVVRPHLPGRAAAPWLAAPPAPGLGGHCVLAVAPGPRKVHGAHGLSTAE